MGAGRPRPELVHRYRMGHGEIRSRLDGTSCVREGSLHDQCFNGSKIQNERLRGKVHEIERINQCPGLGAFILFCPPMSVLHADVLPHRHLRCSSGERLVVVR